MQVMRRFITRAHVGRNVFVHLAPIEVGNAIRSHAKSSALQKESKHVKRSSGTMERYAWVRFAGKLTDCLAVLE